MPGQERGAHAVGHGAKPQIKAGGLDLVVADRGSRGKRARWRSAGAGPVRAALRLVIDAPPSAPDDKTARTAGWQAGGFSMVGPERFELSTSRPPDGRANQAALRPDTGRYIPVFRAGASRKAHYRRVSPVPPSARAAMLRAKGGQTAGRSRQRCGWMASSAAVRRQWRLIEAGKSRIVAQGGLPWRGFGGAASNRGGRGLERGPVRSSERIAAGDRCRGLSAPGLGIAASSSTSRCTSASATSTSGSRREHAARDRLDRHAVVRSGPRHGARPVRAGSSARRGWSGLRHASSRLIPVSKRHIRRGGNSAARPPA